MAHDVFISHASRDKPVADAVCAALESAGIKCWIAPRDVQAGRSFAGEVTRAIQSAKAMVLIFSAQSNNSDQVIREVQLAADGHLHIIQFRIEDVAANDDLKYFLSIPHWLDAITPPLQQHLGRLVGSIKTLLNSQTAVFMPTASAAGTGAAKPDLASLPSPSAAAPGPAGSEVVPRPPSMHTSQSKGMRFNGTLALIGVALLVLAGVIVWLLGSRNPHRAATAEPIPPSATPVATASKAVSVTKSAAEGNREDSQIYVERGANREKKSDFDGALADYNRALELDAQNAHAYNARGVLKYRKGDLDGAFGDYQKAVELAPKNASVHNNLGKVHLDREELDSALAEYDRSIGLDPYHALSFANRGNAKLRKNELAGALADYNRALQIDSNNPVALESRGSFNMRTGQWWEALADLQKRCDADPATQDYWRLLLWVTEIHFPNKPLADRHLADYLKQRKPAEGPDWNGRVGSFLIGQLRAEDFLPPKETTHRDEQKRCQAWMFAGMKRLTKDDPGTAIGCFQNCLATNQTSLLEYALADAELKQLGK